MSSTNDLKAESSSEIDAANMRRVARSLYVEIPNDDTAPSELTWSECHERRKALLRFCKALTEHAEDENRDFNEKEDSAFRGAKLRLEVVEKQMDEHAANGGHLPSARQRAVMNIASGQRSAWRDPQTGIPVPVLGSKDKLAGAFAGGGSPADSIGAMMRGAITGDVRGLSPMVQQSVATPSAGGHLVPTPMSAQMIDLGRAQSRVIQAGAVTVPMTATTLKMARLDSDPTPYWRAENADITPSEAAFGLVEFQTHTVAILVPASVELVEDAGNFTSVLEAAMGAAIGGEIDRVCLFGSGVDDQPRGLYTTPGVQYVDVVDGSSPPQIVGFDTAPYLPLSRAVEAVANVNSEAGAFILSPRSWGLIDRAADTTGQPLQPPRSVAERQQLVTTRVPDNLTFADRSDTSVIFTGNWPALMLGIRTDMTFEVSRYAGDAFKKLQVLLRIYLRMDVQVQRANQFAIVRGVAPLPAA